MPRQVWSWKEKRRKSGKPAARCDIYIYEKLHNLTPRKHSDSSAMGGQGLTKRYGLLRGIEPSRDLLYRYGALPGGTVGCNGGRLWTIKPWLANPLRYWRTTSHASPYRRKSQNSIYENRLMNNPCAWNRADTQLSYQRRSNSRHSKDRQARWCEVEGHMERYQEVDGFSKVSSAQTYAIIVLVQSMVKYGIPQTFATIINPILCSEAVTHR